MLSELNSDRRPATNDLVKTSGSTVVQSFFIPTTVHDFSSALVLK